MEPDICKASNIYLRRDLKKCAIQFGLGISQPYAAMFHTCIQAIMIQAEQAALGQTLQSGDSLEGLTGEHTEALRLLSFSYGCAKVKLV